VTAVEIMPVADFPGARNWGYDGVLPYAPDASYGRPDDFKAFVAAAHGRGIAVILDVVYNHFGPDGNYIGAYAPGFFTERHHTPWGAAVNVDGEHSRPVREFFISNALYWLTEFRLDGLRFDAVHAILDDSERHLLSELAATVRQSVTDRPVHLILENEDNVASRLAREDDGKPMRYTAQWNDDVHHVLHVAISGEDRGYYTAYANKTELLGRALAEGFAYQGEFMPYRDSERGEPSADLPPGAFVAFLQNHDQIGNRAFGERIGAIARPEAVRAATAVYLLLPQTPMLFMGEEWDASTPFQFFCDFTGDLAEAVRKGRREEFKRFAEFQDPDLRQRIPDPEAAGTFEASKLKWDEIEATPHRERLAWTTRLIAARHEAIVPLIPDMGGRAGAYAVVGPNAVTVTWTTRSGTRLRLDANLKATAQTGFSPGEGRVLWLEGEAEGEHFAPWTVRWTVADKP
jgi:maltooligosyltrehalose trehalohydrolase